MKLNLKDILKQKKIHFLKISKFELNYFVIKFILEIIGLEPIIFYLQNKNFTFKLYSLYLNILSLLFFNLKIPGDRFELSTQGFSDLCSKPLSYPGIIKR